MNNKIKKCSRFLVVRKMQISITCRYCMYMLKWLQLKTPKTPNVNIWGNHNFYSFLIELQNGVSTLENCLKSSHKVKYISTLWFSNLLPGHLQQRNENMFTKRHVQVCWHSIVFLWWKRETTKIIQYVYRIDIARNEK